MAKKIANKEQQEQKANNPSIGSDRLYTQEIVSAFSKEMNAKNEDYFSLPKGKLAKKFQEFVKEKYGNNILQTLIEGKIGGKPIDVELNDQLHKGFKIADLLKSESSTIIAHTIASTSEQDAIMQWLSDLYHRWFLLSDDKKQQIPYEEFLRQVWYKIQYTPEWEFQYVKILGTHKGYNTITIVDRWNDFLQEKGISDEKIIKKYTELLNFDHFDPTEKIACLTVVESLYTKIQDITKGDTNKAKELSDIAYTIFWSPVHPSPSNLSWTSIESLTRTLHDFFMQADHILTDSDRKNLQDITISLKDCIQTGEKEGLREQWTLDTQLRDKKFSTLKKSLQWVTNAFVQTDLINNVENAINDLDESIDSFSSSFDIPGNMHQFFNQFGKPADVMRENSSPSYLRLKQREEQLREVLAENSIESDERERYEQELWDILKKITEYKTTTHTPTRDNYFSYIQEQVTGANREIGQTEIEWIAPILKKLLASHWDSTSLSSEESNILMKASVAIQLLQVKKKDGLQHMGTNFQTYAQFVSALYDFNSSHVSITTQDGTDIDLNFLSKKLVGQPFDYQNIDITHLNGLENLRVEFEIDLENNPKAEAFLRVMTWWPVSQIIRDFLPPTPQNFPQTITDSSRVRMVDSNGVVYEWYLSESYLTNTDVLGDEEYSELDQAKTYVLYTKPADQFHSDREMVVQKDSTWKTITTAWWKQQPLFVNSATLADWQSIEIIGGKKATISDKHLKALSLGYTIADKLTASELLDPQNNSAIQEQIKQQDNDFSSVLQEDPRQLAQDTYQEDVSWEREESSQAWEFDNWWSSFIGTKDIPCEIGTRIAIQQPKTLEGKELVNSFPEGPQFLSVTVKSLTKDTQGKVIGAKLAFDNLTRSGKCTISDITFEGKNIEKMREVFGTGHVIETPWDKWDYNTTLARLQTSFSNNKVYQREKLNGLDFDGRNFLKGKEKITHFIAPGLIEGEKKEKYRVEYTIEKLGDTYQVTSSPYFIDISDKQGKKKKETTKFDATLDLSGVLLLIASKKLEAKTQKEYILTQAEHPSDGVVPEKRYGWKSWRSLRTVLGVLKDGWKSIIDQWKKKLDETGKSELKYLLFQEANIYRKLDGIFWGALEFFDMNIFDDLAEEAEAEAMNYGFKKVEARYNYLKKFHKSYNYGGSKSFETNINGSWKMAADDVLEALQYYESGNQIPYKLRTQVAAALWYNMETFKTWYTGALSPYANQGIYIKLLLWQQAYNNYLTRYNKIKAELDAAPNWKVRNQKQDQLMRLEYEFISHNISGGAQQMEEVRDNPEPWYYQRLYGRDYGNKIRAAVGPMQSVNTSKDHADIKALIDGSNFDHLYAEFYNHVRGGRIEEAIYEIIAMQHVANTKDQYDEVMVAMMTGMLNGMFLHNIGQDTRENLKAAFRNSAIPIGHWIEDNKGPKMITDILTMATADMGEQAFDKTFNIPQVLSYSSYDLSEQTSEWKSEFATEFYKDWLSTGSWVRKRVMSFLHMDKTSLQSDDNMLRVWKSPIDDLPVIFWKQVTWAQKVAVESIMDELYFNTDRGASIENYNRGPGFPYPNTTIENFTRDTINPKIQNGSFWPGTGDHGAVLYNSILNEAPDTVVLETDVANKLAFHTDNFFRMFGGLGALKYTGDEIQTFYHNVRKAQQQTDPWDRKRLLRFPIIEKIYSKWPIPPIVESALTKYMKFFEKNLNLFDKSVGASHLIPQTPDKSNFLHAFTEDIGEYIYIPDKKWKHMGSGNERAALTNKLAREDSVLMNGMMDNRNSTARGLKNSRSGNSINMTLDKKIKELNGIRDWEEREWEKVWVLIPEIEITNRESIDTSIPINSLYKTDEEKIRPYLKKENKKKQGDTSVNEQVYDALTNMGIDPYQNE